MRKIFMMSIVLAGMVGLAIQPAKGALLSGPMGLKGAIQHIKFETPTLAPLAYTEFCLRYTEQCKPKLLFRGGPVNLTDERRAELVAVNKSVNGAIIPEANTGGLAAEAWLINPDRGDCNDYAVSKRHALLKSGWPARALLLSEVVTRAGEHHLVLVVRTTGGDLVLDNLNREIKLWTRAPYAWVRIQQPDNARMWSTIGARRV